MDFSRVIGAAKEKEIAAHRNGNGDPTFLIFDLRSFAGCRTTAGRSKSANRQLLVASCLSALSRPAIVLFYLPILVGLQLEVDAQGSHDDEVQEP